MTNTYFIVALVLSVAIIAIEYAPAVFKVLGEFDGSSNYTLESTSQYAGNLLSSLSDAPFAASLITALGWGLVGLILYTVFYLLANILIDARNEIQVAAEHSAEGIGNYEVLRHSGTKLIAALAYIVFIGVSLTYLFEIWMSLAYIYVYSGLLLVNIPYLLLAIVALTVNLYLIFVFAYLIWKSNETVVLYN